ncbi:MAG TPA: TIGR03435 family protein [Terracidiphilus sp.]|nr:TIGR03435 family protein [Terracidiphilus sp.]
MRSLSAVKTLLLANAAISSFCVFAQSSPPSQSQSAAPDAPAFDVAAIHQHIPELHERSHIVNSSGRFTTINVDLKSIIQWAYDLPESRIVGGPSWIGSTRWNIEAKADNALDMQKSYDSAAAQLEKQRMVWALLADRFHLMAHQETRELPIYHLIVAKGGAKFLETKAESSKFDRWNNRMELQGGDNTVAILAEQLAEVLGRVVVDKTGIQGRYKIMLKWTPDDRADASAASADSGPSIFTAIEEQLGLELESAKGPVSVLVIDRAEMPSEN